MKKQKYGISIVSENDSYVIDITPLYVYKIMIEEDGNSQFGFKIVYKIRYNYVNE